MGDITGHLLRLTAGELMNREVKTLSADMTLKEAAQELSRLGLRGMPVVEQNRRVVGMLSLADLVRWVAQRNQQSAGKLQACAFQQVERHPGGKEEIRCLLPVGSCPFQRQYLRTDGQQVLLCGDPAAFPTDWQIIEGENRPLRVRDVMTTVVRTVSPETTVPQLARLMLEEGVHRLLITDESGLLLGIVSADDLLQVLAHIDDERFSNSQE
jgi:CBS-domain-containing membrane protein